MNLGCHLFQLLVSAEIPCAQRRDDSLSLPNATHVTCRRWVSNLSHQVLSKTFHERLNPVIAHFFVCIVQFVCTSNKVVAIIFRFPLQAITHLSVCMKESLSKLGCFNMDSSTCHKCKHGSLRCDFIFALLDHKWARHIDPQYVKGGASASLYTGRSAIFCSPILPCRLQHLTHLNRRFLTATLQLLI